MKTYEEALGIIAVPLHDEAAAARAVDHIERALPISEEVIRSERTRNLLSSMMLGVNLDPNCDCQRCEKEFCLAMTAFLNGIRIGMEMEKQTLCEPS